MAGFLMKVVLVNCDIEMLRQQEVKGGQPVRQLHGGWPLAEKGEVGEEPDSAGGMTAPEGVGYCLGPGLCATGRFGIRIILPCTPTANTPMSLLSGRRNPSGCVLPANIRMKSTEKRMYP